MSTTRGGSSEHREIGHHSQHQTMGGEKTRDGDSIPMNGKCTQFGHLDKADYCEQYETTI